MVENKSATINPTNDDDKSFQYVATVAFNHEEVGKHLQRISKFKPFVSKYNWKGMTYSSGKDNCKKFEKNNPKTALTVLHIKEISIYCASWRLKVLLQFLCIYQKNEDWRFYYSFFVYIRKISWSAQINWNFSLNDLIKSCCWYKYNWKQAGHILKQQIVTVELLCHLKLNKMIAQLIVVSKKVLEFFLISMTALSGLLYYSNNH